MPADILAFFERYRDAFNGLDGAAIAQLYAIPSGIASDSGYTHWPTFESIRDNMVALCNLYRQNGYASAHFMSQAFLPLGSDFAIADLSWTIQRTEGLEPWRFNTSYNLMRTVNGWRVLMCTAYSEQRLHDHSAP